MQMAAFGSRCIKELSTGVHLKLMLRHPTGLLVSASQRHHIYDPVDLVPVLFLRKPLLETPVLIPVNLKDSPQSLLQSISLEIKTLKNPEIQIISSNPVESNPPSLELAEDFISNAPNLKLVIQNSSERYIIHICTVQASATLKNIYSELKGTRSNYLKTSSTIKEISLKAYRLTNRLLAVASVGISLQMSIIAYIALEISWDLAEPITYILGSLDAVLWSFIYLLTGRSSYSGLRDYIEYKYIDYSLKKHKTSLNEIYSMYLKRANLVRAVYNWRRIINRSCLNQPKQHPLLSTPSQIDSNVLP